MELSQAIQNIYREKENLVIVGLTGRTGAGCSTVAKILRKEKFSDLDLKEPSNNGCCGTENQKYSIIYEFMEYKGRWKPFTVIDISSIILSFILEEGIDKLIDYMESLRMQKEGKTINIGDFSLVKEKLNGLKWMCEKTNKFNITDIENILYQGEKNENKEKLKTFIKFYTETIVEYKESFKNVLDDCNSLIITDSKVEEEKRARYDLYTFLMQQFGNNLRASGHPFIEKVEYNKSFELVNKINNIIKIIRRYHKLENQQCRICIDAFRNPYEIHFFKDKYKYFYAFSINTDDGERKERLQINPESLDNLDKIEYPNKFKTEEELFYHQNIKDCLEISDVHIYNNHIDNGKYFFLTEQLIKYIALILHPGLVTPSKVERCMQLAYIAKLSSGCLSRQVGAVVTGADFSIRAVGWNDVPEGQVSCNLRDVRTYCKNKDKNLFSKYEVEDKQFGKVMDKINEEIKNGNIDTYGLKFHYCFKDIYNGLQKNKNQVYTRSLHAEENAFLQTAKYGGTGVKDGKLFVTASPCELCSKKSYQLGIKDIYYIDPYPGISASHILKFGKRENPELKLFYGAVGYAYLTMYTPKLAYKDELSILTGINSTEVSKNIDNIFPEALKFQDVIYNQTKLSLEFEDRCTMKMMNHSELQIKKEGIKTINKMQIWSGNKCCIELFNSDPKCRLRQKINGEQILYSLDYEEPLRKDEIIKFDLLTNMSDSKQVMQPFLCQIIKHVMKELILVLKVPKNLIQEVRKCVYADNLMSVCIERKSLKKSTKIDKNLDIYELKIVKPNVNYTYAIEWDFK